MIISTDKIKSQLRELNRNYEGRQTWNELYAGVDLAEKQAVNQATSSYESDVLDAYISAFKTRSQVANSNLGSGFKEAAIADLDYDLAEAFNSYKQNYASQLSTIGQNALDAKTAIDEELTTYSTNVANYQKSMYGYLTDLYNRAYGLNTYEDVGEDLKLKELFENDMLWNRYTNAEYQYQTDDNGNIIYDEKGKPIVVKDEKGNDVISGRKLLTEEELYSSLYDKENNIKESGVDFYDQMLNQLGTNYSFDAYLNKTNPELYSWSQQASVYDYNKAGTNQGSFKTLMGLDSQDYEYKYVERFGGISEETMKSYMNELGSALTKLSNTGEDEDTNSIISEYESIISTLNENINALKLDENTKKELQGVLNDFSTSLNTAKNKVATTTSWRTAEETAETFNRYVKQAKEQWSVTSRTWTERALLSGSNYVTAGIAAIGEFLNGIMSDTVENLFPKSVKAAEDAFGRSPRKEASENRRTGNKQLVEDIEAKYLDLITYLSKYSSKNNK